MLGDERHLNIPVICIRCKRDDGERIQAVEIYHGSSLCRKHVEEVRKEIEDLDKLWEPGVD